MRWIEKLAQTATLPVATPAVTGSPTSFQMLDYFPSMRKGFSNPQLGIIQTICTLLNVGLFYASSGQQDVNKMRNAGFAKNTSLNGQAKCYSNLVHDVHEQFLTNKHSDFLAAVPKQDVEARINFLKASTGFTGLTNVQTTSQAASMISTNPKDKLDQLFQQLRNVSM